MKYQKMPLEVSLVLRYLHQKHGEPLKKLIEMYPQFKRSTIHRHMRKPLNETTTVTKENPNARSRGRPRKNSDRDKRHLLNALRTLRENNGNFNATDIQNEAGLHHLSKRTVTRMLNNMGYRFKQCRKKGILVHEDLNKRLKFARRCKRLPTNFWKEGIAFYLDGVSFVHKTNPSQHARTTRTRAWMKKGESLHHHCTTKGKKAGVNGRVAKFMCAISYQRGFIECYHYEEALNGEFCKSYIENGFPKMFAESPNPRGKLFLQDGDPSQNSALAKEAMDVVGCRLFKIPPRSPDLNPIENTFNNIRKKIREDAVKQKITKETYLQFCHRVKQTILNYSIQVIDRTIESMPKRVDAVIKNKGARTKY